MSINFSCPHCGHAISAADSQDSTLIDCPACHKTVLIQSDSDDPMSDHKDDSVGSTGSGIHVAPPESDSDVVVLPGPQGDASSVVDISLDETGSGEELILDSVSGGSDYGESPGEGESASVTDDVILPVSSDESSVEIDEETSDSLEVATSSGIIPMPQDPATGSFEVPAEISATSFSHVGSRKKNNGPLMACYASGLFCGIIVTLLAQRLVPSNDDGGALLIRQDHGQRAGGTKWTGPDPSAALPDRFRTTIGKSITAGNLELTPLNIKRSRVRMVHFSNSALGSESQKPCLVLTVKLKNLTEDLSFSPLDEMFLRKSKYPDYSYIELEGAEQIGMYDLAPLSEFNVEGQSFAELPPGKTMETIIVAEEGSSSMISDEQMTWRILLRAGGRPGNTYAMVFGVDFTKAEVQGL